MKPTLMAVVIAGVVAAAVPAARAQTDSDQKRLADLERACEAAREKRLAPMRAERIERCVKDDKRSRADCTEEFANWGNTQRVATGTRPGMFYDLPECVAAEDARQKYRR
jgi:Ni/Co efflux regulator RcnB